MNCADHSFCWMRISVFSFFGLLLCIAFLLDAAVFADLALYLAVCGLASVELPCSLTMLVLQALLAPFPRLPILGAFRALFLSSSPARDLQHRIWRLRCCLLEVGYKNLDFVASHHLGHLCFSWHVWSRCSFLRDLDPFLKLHHLEEFPGCPHFLWDISCVDLERQIFSGFSHCDHTLLVQLSVSVSFQRLKFNLAGETRNRAPKFALSRSCWRTDNHRSNSL